MTTQRRKDFIIKCAYIALIFVIMYIVFRFAAPVLMPFIIAFVVASIVKPIIHFFTEKCRIKNNISAICCVVIFYCTVGFLTVLLGIKLIDSLKNFVLTLPNFYVNTVEPTINELLNTVEKFLQRLDPALSESASNISNNIISSLGSLVSDVSVKLLGSITGYASSIPGILISILITIISTFFIAVDYRKLSDYVFGCFSEKTRSLIVNIRKTLGKTLWKYISSYALILFITFAEVCIGLLILGVPNAVLVALLIACFDILPIVGTGTIVIPWAIISFIEKDFLLGFGLLVVYIVITVVRNIIEPKIIGKQVGLHPIVTLICMVAGTSLFGMLGLWGVPLTVALIKNLDDQGVTHVFSGLGKHGEEAKAEG